MELLYFSVLSDISFAPFTGGMSGCGIAIQAGFVSYFQSTGAHLEVSKQHLLHRKASAKECTDGALEKPPMNQRV